VLDVVLMINDVPLVPPGGTMTALAPNWHDAPAGNPVQVKATVVEYPASELIAS